MADIIVTTTSDVVDATDNETSLREAIAQANANSEADTITFDATVFANGELIRLDAALGELVLSTDITIDGDVDSDGIADVTITGDTAGDDQLLAGTDFTDAINNTAYSDNVRVFKITGGTANLNSLNITGGYSSGDGGGIEIANRGSLMLDQSTLIGNRTNAKVVACRQGRLIQPSPIAPLSAMLPMMAEA